MYLEKLSKDLLAHGYTDMGVMFGVFENGESIIIDEFIDFPFLKRTVIRDHEEGFEIILLESESPNDKYEVSYKEYFDMFDYEIVDGLLRIWTSDGDMPFVYNLHKKD